MAISLGFQASEPRKQGETAQQRQARLAREREQLQAAREGVGAGHSTSGAQLDALIDRFERGDDLDAPPSAKT